MSESPRDTFVRDADPGRVPLVVALDRAVLAGHPGFDVAIKYRMLTYALGGDYRHWVCAIDAHPRKAVCLRFLYGTLLSDPGHVFRGALTSPLRTIDIASVDELDARLVSAYVVEAVSRFDEFTSRG